MVTLATRTVILIMLTLCLLAGCVLFISGLYMRKGLPKKVTKASKLRRKRAGSLIAAGVLLAILLPGALASAYVLAYSSLVRIDLPEGRLVWSDSRPANAAFCVPAAYSDKARVLGKYRLGGEEQNSGQNGLKHCVSLTDSTFYLDTKWHSKMGFQQHPLVVNSIPVRYGRDKDRRHVRRALCKDGKGMFILQSNFPVTMTDFAAACSKYATNAVNLDMGNYGYGYTSMWGHKFHLLPYAWFKREDQTNWLYVIK